MYSEESYSSHKQKIRIEEESEDEDEDNHSGHLSLQKYWAEQFKKEGQNDNRPLLELKFDVFS